MRHHRRILAYLVLLMIYAAASALPAFAEPQKTRLKNGLTVIIEEEHSAPVVSLQMWVKVGSADEPEKWSGISHVFEHMLFKGTATKKVGEIASMIESVGGEINAYTSFDNTVYYTTVPSRYFATGLDVIGDSIQHSAFDPEELSKEIDVVLEEVRMNLDKPERQMYMALIRNAFSVHPYRREVLGTVDSIKSITRKDILDTFKKWYIPNNMTLVIAGDIDADEVLAAVRDEFKDFKKGPDPHTERAAEPAQKKLRTGLLEKDVKDARFGMAFHIPDVKSEDTFALDVLQLVLASGQTSRLVKRVKIDDELVHSISSYPMSLKDPGLFFITATLEPENIDATIDATFEEIERLRKLGPDYEELERAKFNIESNFIYSRDTTRGIADKLGYYETLMGDPIYEKEYIKNIRKVSAEDIQRVIGKYLTPRNMTLEALVPLEEKGKVTTQGLARSVNSAAASATAMFAAMKEDEEKKTTKVVLDNGMTLIVKEVHSNPTVAFYATFPGGLRFEVPEKNGIGNFTAAMLTRGTKKRTREELATESEEMAAGVGGFSGWNSTGVSGTFLSMHFKKGLSILADVIRNPTFPEVEIEKLRPDLLASIKRQEDNLPAYTFKLLYRELFKTHPYGMPVSGTEETVSSITRDDMVAHHARFFVPGRMVLSIAGDIDTADAIEKVKELFGDFKNDSPEPPAPKTEAPQTKIRETGAVKEGKAQTNIGIAFQGTTISEEDRYPLMVMTEVLSGQGGRLFMDLRDRQSLAYSLTAFSKNGVDPGMIGVYIGCAPEKKDKAVSEIFKHFKMLREEEITDAEMNRAKKSLIGGYEIGLQSISAQASNAANNELYGLGYDFYKEYPDKINAVTAADVMKAARKYLTLDAYTISIVGPNGIEKKE